MDRPIRLVHDSATSKIPWESLPIAGQYPALNGGLTRHFLRDEAIRKVAADRMFGKSLDILMVVDPNNNLPGAREEAKTLQHLMGKVGRLNLVVRTGAEASRQQLRTRFSFRQL